MAVIVPRSSSDARSIGDDSDPSPVTLGPPWIPIDPALASPRTVLSRPGNIYYPADGPSSSTTSTASASIDDSTNNAPGFSQTQNHQPSAGNHQGPIRTRNSSGSRRHQPYTGPRNTLPHHTRRPATEADLSSLNAGHESTLAIVRRFHLISLDRARRDLRTFERHGGFGIGGYFDENPNLRAGIEAYVNPFLPLHLKGWLTRGMR